jgi:hypothetical protein
MIHCRIHIAAVSRFIACLSRLEYFRDLACLFYDLPRSYACAYSHGAE